jgi:hypothetical protein
MKHLLAILSFFLITALHAQFHADISAGSMQQKQSTASAGLAVEYKNLIAGIGYNAAIFPLGNRNAAYFYGSVSYDLTPAFIVQVKPIVQYGYMKFSNDIKGANYWQWAYGASLGYKLFFISGTTGNNYSSLQIGMRAKL